MESSVRAVETVKATLEAMLRQRGSRQRKIAIETMIDYLDGPQPGKSAPATPRPI